MDVFIEHLVKKRPTTGDRLKIVGLCLAAVLLILLLFILSGLLRPLAMFVLLLVAGVIYGWWKLLNSFRVEYEYALTNGEMDVDKIIAQSRRKRLVTVNLRNIELMAPVHGGKSAEYGSARVAQTIDASVSPNDADAWFILFQKENSGLTRLVFTPDERIIEGAKIAAPRKVFEQ